MGTFTTLDGQSPVDGSVAQPVASGRYGMHDPLRQQVAVVIGQAYSFKDSTNPADRLSIYLFGDALARPELGGVIAQDGNAPTMSIAAATGDSDCATGIFCGYAPILLAPGEVVKRGQHLEPIPTGANRASMLQDVEAGRRTEIDAITGVFLDMARRHGADAPTHRAVFTLVKRLEG